MDKSYIQIIEEKLRKEGRVLTGWWDNRPIHRRMTVAELAERDGLDPDAVALGIALLGHKEYKPTYKQD